jgi:hypothetical protein
LHTQFPPEQTCPAAHWALLPQAQVPVTEQLSASELLQAVQVPPSVPQVERVGVLQVVPEQQPVGQPVLSHTQLLPLQCWPLTQAGPVPQRQLPEVEQALARVALQAEQAAPLLPHCEAVAGETQLVPLQHPLAQLAELQPAHAWLVQLPPPHEAQVAPPVPQALLDVPDWHWLLPSQQPVGHEVPSHTQAPLTQCRPLPQAALPPHRHEPLELLQWSEVLGSQVWQVAPLRPQTVGQL